jgi:hypothetical protein
VGEHLGGAAGQHFRVRHLHLGANDKHGGAVQMLRARHALGLDNQAKSSPRSLERSPSSLP